MSNDKEKKHVDKTLEESLPPEVAEVLKEAPPEIRKKIQMGMFRASGPMASPLDELLDKVTPEHIDKFLDNTHKDVENDYKLKSSNRFFYFVYLLVIVSFMVFLVVFLAQDNQALLNDILKILLIFAGGFGSGFGYKAYLEKRK